jgi:hypothetical protein
MTQDEIILELIKTMRVCREPDKEAHSHELNWMPFRLRGVLLEAEYPNDLLARALEQYTYDEIATIIISTLRSLE